jgi:molecular chaperone DnaJ
VAKKDGMKGDLLVTVEVVVPEALTDRARSALASFNEALGATNPRAGLFAVGA